MTKGVASIATVATVALVALSTGPAGASTATRVAPGDYQMAPAIPADQSYQVGAFTVQRSAGKRKIVATDKYAGIYYPDANECDDLALALDAESIPNSAAGRFRVSDRVPVDDGFVEVAWKGHWSKPGVVAGTITISEGSCTSTHKWAGGKLAPS